MNCQDRGSISVRSKCNFQAEALSTRMFMYDTRDHLAENSLLQAYGDISNASFTDISKILEFPFIVTVAVTRTFGHVTT